MGFTQVFFIFVFFPLSLGIFFMSYFMEKKLNIAKKLRFVDISTIMVSLAFYFLGGTAGRKGMLAIVMYIFMVYIFGVFIKRFNNDSSLRGKKSVIALSIMILLSILFYCKYISFVTGAIWELTGIGGIVTALWMPLGISFITFSAISYVVDIYRDDAPAGSVIDAFLYMSLFTKIVSGPIVLWKDFSPQIKNRSINIDVFVIGINRIIIGFAKKILLADYFGIVVSNIQANGNLEMDVPTAWICTILYTLQIYYDFAGYSDIAIGLSNLFGYNIKKNFNFPYTSLSITEFWRNWHISLGNWFREYLYIPLGGNRNGKRRTLINLSIVFIVTGIWHGAGFNYIFWGMLHGVFILIERCNRNKEMYTKTPKFIKWFVTMFVVNLGWEAFRIQNPGELVEFYKLLFGFFDYRETFFTWQYYLDLKLIVFVVIGLLGATLFKLNFFNRFNNKLDTTYVGFAIKEMTLIVIMAISIVCMVSSTYSPFIYFQY